MCDGRDCDVRFAYFRQLCCMVADAGRMLIKTTCAGLKSVIETVLLAMHSISECVIMD